MSPGCILSSKALMEALMMESNHLNFFSKIRKLDVVLYVDTEPLWRLTELCLFLCGRSWFKTRELKRGEPSKEVPNSGVKEKTNQNFWPFDCSASLQL